MNILVLENDPQELAFIQQTLSGKRHIITPVSTSDQAWQTVQTGRVRFLIANWDASDLGSSQFIQRIRTLNPAEPIYILLITSKNLEDGAAPSGMDDIIQRPLKAADLKNRVAIAERIISLTDHLAMAREQLENRAVFDSLINGILIYVPAVLRRCRPFLLHQRGASESNKACVWQHLFHLLQEYFHIFPI